MHHLFRIVSSDLYLGVGSSGYSVGTNFTNGLGVPTVISLSDQKDILSNTDKVSEITITPIPFTENKTGEIIAEISMPNSSASSFHLLKLNDPNNNDFSLVPDTHRNNNR